MQTDDPEVARAFKSASAENQRKPEALLSIRLIEAKRTPESLEVVMDEIGRKAQERGLTPEILKAILDWKRS